MWIAVNVFIVIKFSSFLNVFNLLQFRATSGRTTRDLGTLQSTVFESQLQLKHGVSPRLLSKFDAIEAHSLKLSQLLLII